MSLAPSPSGRVEPNVSRLPPPRVRPSRPSAPGRSRRCCRCGPDCSRSKSMPPPAGTYDGENSRSVNFPVPPGSSALRRGPSRPRISHSSRATDEPAHLQARTPAHCERRRSYEAVSGRHAGHGVLQQRAPAGQAPGARTVTRPAGRNKREGERSGDPDAAGPVTESTTPRGACATRHPLIRDVRCQRLEGHPGKHRATLGPHDRLLEWSEEEQKAG